MSASPPPPLPHDPRIPAADALFDPVRIGEVLAPVLGEGPVDRLRWRYLARTDDRVVVQYEATTERGVVDLAAVAHGTAVEAFVYPHDPALPVLAEPDRLVELAGGRGGPPRRLAWVPMQRAALRFDDAVVKVYADPIEAIGARDRMDRVAEVVTTARPRRLDVATGVVVQSVVEGRPLERDDAAAWAGPAVGLLQQLQNAEFDGLPLLRPTDVLEAAAAPFALVSFCIPQLTERLEQLMQRLQVDVPEAGETVVAHGDFNVGQLLETGPRALAVIDVDTLCLASPSLDLAGYATNVVSGRRDDLAAAFVLLDELGRHTRVGDDLRWYVAAALARRVDRAIRRMKRDWPKRTERLVDAVEAAVAAL